LSKSVRYAHAPPVRLRFGHSQFGPLLGSHPAACHVRHPQNRPLRPFIIPYRAVEALSGALASLTPGPKANKRADAEAAGGAMEVDPKGLHNEVGGVGPSADAGKQAPDPPAPTFKIPPAFPFATKDDLLAASEA
jgi:hypothetical protein